MSDTLVEVNEFIDRMDKDLIKVVKWRLWEMIKYHEGEGEKPEFVGMLGMSRQFKVKFDKMKARRLL